MTTYPIDFVAKNVTSQRLTLTRRQSITEANASFQTTIAETGGSQWQLAWSWPRMTHSAAETVSAWVMKLRGQIGTFRYFPAQAYAFKLGGTTLASAGYGYSTDVSVAGWTPNFATGLRAGQYLQIGNQLLAITDAAAGADANGNVTISFEPQLRMPYAAGTAVNLVNPSGIFRLNASEGIGFGLDPDRLPDFSSMSAREDTNA